ncbi:hypothetical protein A2U01_0075017, partial [Trifolium medium]|nr:hypothetical protein [Trifolium medium]
DLKVENGADALNVSSGKGGGKSSRARSKGGKWTCFHCLKKDHFKRDCPEWKGKDDFAHVTEEKGYEYAEALVVSS